MNLDKIKTSLQYSKNIFTTGAIFETSRDVEIEICSKLPKEENKTIVEFGMGHGNITKEILNNISNSSKLYCFEINKKFCSHVKSLIPDSRLKIINDDARNMRKYIKGGVDSFVASIPFSFLSNKTGEKIIKDSYNILNEGCYYSQVLYTKFNFKKFDTIFDECNLIKIPNLLTEYIFHCKKNVKNGI